MYAVTFFKIISITIMAQGEMLSIYKMLDAHIIFVLCYGM